MRPIRYDFYQGGRCKIVKQTLNIFPNKAGDGHGVNVCVCEKEKDNLILHTN